MGFIIYKVLLFVLLFAGFLCMCLWLKKSRVIRKGIEKGIKQLNSASLSREKYSAEKLHLVGRKKSFLERVNSRLVYSGIPRKLPFVTAEVWVLAVVLSGFIGYLVGFLVTRDFMLSLVIGVCITVLLPVIEYILGVRNYSAVDRSLMEFLNLLGNYSITSAEITGVFYVISRYFDEPLKTVLEECYYEAQTTGDTSGALINLAEKVEHPKFKEIINNVEISSRYSGNFSSIVKESRRLIQDYSRNKKERQSIIKDGIVNMLILGIMFVVMVVISGDLVGMSVMEIILGTMFGRVCVCLVAMIYAAFVFKVISINRD